MTQEIKNENKQEKQKLPKIFLVLRFVSLFLLLGGITLIVISATVFSGEFGTEMGVRFGGICMLVFAIVTAFAGFSPSIAKAQIRAQKYVVTQTKEDLKDVAEIHGEIIEPVSEKAARGAKKGFSQEEKKFCKMCGLEIDKDAKFCEHCGAKQ